MEGGNGATAAGEGAEGAQPAGGAGGEDPGGECSGIQLQNDPALLNSLFPARGFSFRRKKEGFCLSYRLPTAYKSEEARNASDCGDEFDEGVWDVCVVLFLDE